MARQLLISKGGRFISASLRGGNQFIDGGCGADCKGAAGGLHRNTRSRLVEKLPSMFTLSRLAAVLFSMAQIVAPTSMAAPKSVVEPAPPQPVSQKVMVKRGASVEIPLKIHGTRSQTLAWIIRQPPLHGKLSEVRATGQEAAAVTYRPPADLRVVSDRFTFSVRSTEGISAPVDVTIAITDDAPQISAPAEMNVGRIWFKGNENSRGPAPREIGRAHV